MEKQNFLGRVLVTLYQWIRRHVPEDLIVSLQVRETQTSRIYCRFFQINGKQKRRPHFGFVISGTVWLL
jgi:hypothetical protein